MEGIYYIKDTNDENRFVQIDLKKYGELWEDFFDAFLSDLVKNEETISVEELGEELREKGVLEDV